MHERNTSQLLQNKSHELRSCCPLEVLPRGQSLRHVTASNTCPSAAWRTSSSAAPDFVPDARPPPEPCKQSQKERHVSQGALTVVPGCCDGPDQPMKTLHPRPDPGKLRPAGHIRPFVHPRPARVRLLTT